MAKKVKLTRPELKRYRDQLTRFERYLPMLKLKQQQLQIAVRDIARQRKAAQQALDVARGQFEPYQAVLADVAGVNVEQLAEPDEVRTGRANIAGVNIPVFEDISFPQAQYSLFATPAWVDRALLDLRQVSQRESELEIVKQQYSTLQDELTKISQRVNLFEKVKIPEAREAIRLIRIKLGDEMAAGVCRAKIAKAKIAATSGLQDWEEQA